MSVSDWEIGVPDYILLDHVLKIGWIWYGHPFRQVAIQSQRGDTNWGLALDWDLQELGLGGSSILYVSALLWGFSVPLFFPGIHFYKKV